MRRIVVVAIAATFPLLLGGCAVSSTPSYKEVTEQTKASLKEIADLMPPGSVATLRPDQSPDACGSSADESYFYTGAVDITLPVGTDVAALVGNLPSQLGDTWQEVPSVKLSLPRVELHDTKTDVHVNVIGSEPEEPIPSLYLNGISRCGTGPVE